MSESNKGECVGPGDNGGSTVLEGASEKTNSSESDIENRPQPEHEVTKEKYPIMSQSSQTPQNQCGDVGQGELKFPKKPISIVEQVQWKLTNYLRYLQTSAFESALEHFSNVFRNLFGKLNGDLARSPRVVGIQLRDQYWRNWALMPIIHNHNQKIRMLRTLHVEKDTAICRMSTRIKARVISQMTSNADEWLRDHLTPDNISEVRNICDHLTTSVLGGLDSAIQQTVWVEIQEIVREECRKTYTDYLNLIEESLQIFYLAIKNQFDSQSSFTTKELDQCFQEEVKNATKHLIPDNSEICDLVRVGCNKLMEHVRDRIKIVEEVEPQENEALFKKLPEPNQVLLEKCIEIRRQLDEGIAFKFKFDDAKEIFEGKLVDAINCAMSMDMDSKRDQINTHMAELEKWISICIKN